MGNFCNSLGASDCYQLSKDFAPVVIALVALLIASVIQYRQWKTAHHQWKTAQDRLKLDLFERRMDFYKNIENLVIETLKINWKYDFEFFRTRFQMISEADFLFDRRIVEFCGQIMGAVDTLLTAIDTRNVYADPTTDAEMWNRTAKEISESKQKLRKLASKMHQEFSRALSFSHVS